MKESLEDDVSKFFTEGRGQVAIYDANVSALGAGQQRRIELTPSSVQNGTRAVRKEVREKFESMGINVFFIGERHMSRSRSRHKADVSAPFRREHLHARGHCRGQHSLRQDQLTRCMSLQPRPS